MQLYLPIAQMSLDPVMLTGLGLAVGVLSGVFGIGGGFVTTPLLIFLGVPPAIAAGTGAVQVVASSVSGAVSHWSRRNVDVTLAAVLVVSGILASFAGVLVLRFLRSIGQADLTIALADQAFRSRRPERISGWPGAARRQAAFRSSCIMPKMLPSRSLQ